MTIKGWDGRVVKILVICTMVQALCRNFLRNLNFRIVEQVVGIERGDLMLLYREGSQNYVFGSLYFSLQHLRNSVALSGQVVKATAAATGASRMRAEDLGSMTAEKSR